MKKVYPYLFLCVLFLLLSSAGSAFDISNSFSQIFIENKGQVKDEKNNQTDNVLFYSQGKEMQLFVTSTGYSIVTTETSDKKTIYHKIDIKLEHALIQSNQIIFVKGNHPSFNFYHPSSIVRQIKNPFQ